MPHLPYRFSGSIIHHQKDKYLFLVLAKVAEISKLQFSFAHFKTVEVLGILTLLFPFF